MSFNSVDDSATPLEALEGSTADYTTDNTTLPPAQQPPRSRKKIYIIIIAIVALILVAGIAFYIAGRSAPVEPSAKKPVPITINTQSLDNGTLNKLIPQSAPGATKQQLTIEPDTLFKNAVEVQGGLRADKNLDVGGNTNIAGTTTMQGAVGINNNLAVRGSLSVAGALSAASISVGSLTIANITVSGNLNFGGHIIPAGSEPTVRSSNGTRGGTVTIDGNDTAGTITVNIGNGAPVTGELAIINFRTAFATTPKVQLTPINAAASSLNYYATRSASFFTIDSTTASTNGASYVFDYLITQ